MDESRRKLAGPHNGSQSLEIPDGPLAGAHNQAGPRRSRSALAYGSRSTAAAANNPYTNPNIQAD